jgi:probable F420-dependent oxidoreductase
VRFVFQYPDFHGSAGDMLQAGSVTAVARAVEAAGWDGFAFTEHPAPTKRWLDAGGHQSVDPFVALSAVAAVTERLTLLTYLAVLPYRNPALLAKAAATVDRISDGRFVLGVGTGYLKAEFFALGVRFDERNELFDEALELLPLHWSGEEFDYTGKHFNCRGTIGLPRPVRQPIPIWIGGNSTMTLRRVAERAQGWMPLSASPRLFATVRSPEISSHDDLRKRMAMLQEFAGARFDELEIVGSYTDHSMYDLGNDNERHRDALGRLAELGITRIVVPGPSDACPAAEEFAQGFASTYF